MKQVDVVVRSLEAEEGMTIASKDRRVLTKKIYLGINDAPENYEEIPDSEAQVLKAEQEAEMERQMKEDEERMRREAGIIDIPAEEVQ